MKDKKELIRTIKFTLFSISAGLVELGTFALLEHFTNLTYGWCYFPALILSVVWNFTLNREYTFKSNVHIPLAMAKVFMFYLIFTPSSTFLGDFLAEKLLWNSYLVTGINMLLNFILEYLYDRFFVFGKTIDTKEKNLN